MASPTLDCIVLWNGQQQTFAFTERFRPDTVQELDEKMLREPVTSLLAQYMPLITWLRL